MRLVDGEDGLAAEVARSGGDELAVAAENVANRLPAIDDTPADDPLEGVQAKVETRDDPEVPAAAPKPPQQLGVVLGARQRHRPVGSDELGADEGVARQPVLRGQVADPAAEGQSRHAGRPDDAARRDQAVRLRGGVEVEPRRAAGSAGDACAGIHLDRAQLREVDHEPVVADAVAGRVVTASAHCDLELVRAREVECGRDVARAGAARDDRGPAVDERVEAAARGVVPGVGGADDGAGQRPPQLVQALRDVCAHCATRPRWTLYRR